MAGPLTPWHTLEIAEVTRRLETSERGLSSSEAERRGNLVGPNQLRASEGPSPWSILADQFRNVLIIILLIAIAISAVVGHGVEAVAILVIVLFAVILGFVQEYRAERAIASLRKLASPVASVLRDGVETDIPAEQLVPGDVVLLKTGDKVPADVRLVESHSLQTEEAPLTGESTPVSKSVETLGDPAVAISDRTNMVYSGTAIARGRGRGVVVEIGMQTELGRIAGMLEEVEPTRTPLQESLEDIGRVLGKIALAIVAVIVALGLYRGQPFIEMLVFGIALAVAVVPEALPAVVTISLAIGVTRMARRNVLVRRLPAVETLGSTSIICSDKTGTITRDEMTLRRVELPGESWKIRGEGYVPIGTFLRDGTEQGPSPRLVELLEAAALSSDAQVTRKPDSAGWEVRGDPTEAALIVAASRAGVDKPRLDDELPRLDEIGFTSERKRMTTLNQRGADTFACSKGAPEVILETCDRMMTADGVAPLEEAARQQFLQLAAEMAEEALRVLAVATKPDPARGQIERGMVFLGLTGMLDSPRSEVAPAIETCREAGIDVVMITGDHPTTACAVAREVGILDGSKRALTGRDLDRLDQSALERSVRDISVYARVSPAHKLRIVQALQKNGLITAMTGDGVNDGPPLKQADIGIAMGITGTDVAREAAAMTLVDDNFASIVGAVEEGRAIFSNIEKYLMYLLSSNIGEIGLMAGAALAGLPMPLTAVQILYVNLATDGLPALALAVDPPDKDLMKEPPRDPRSGIFTRPIVTLMLAGGVWSTIVNLAIFIWALRSGRSVEHAMTMAFVSLVLIQFFKAYNFRSYRHSVLSRPFENRWLNLAIFWEIILLVLILYVPLLAGIFETRPLTAFEWGLIVTSAFTVSPVLEITKALQRTAGRKSAL